MRSYSPQAHAHSRRVTDLLVQYAAYHRDQRNIATHFVGIPMIVLGLLVLLARARFTVLDTATSAAWVAWALMALWYLTRRGAVVLRMVVSLAVAAAVVLAHPLASNGAWLASGLGLFGLGWVLQLLGHYYEGRKPAFLDDMRALLVGPMFIVAEALFSWGWNKPLLAEIERRAGCTHLRDLAHPA